MPSLPVKSQLFTSGSCTKTIVPQLYTFLILLEWTLAPSGSLTEIIIVWVSSVIGQTFTSKSVFCTIQTFAFGTSSSSRRTQPNLTIPHGSIVTVTSRSPRNLFSCSSLLCGRRTIEMKIFVPSSMLMEDRLQDKYRWIWTMSSLEYENRVCLLSEIVDKLFSIK